VLVNDLSARSLIRVILEGKQTKLEVINISSNKIGYLGGNLYCRLLDLGTLTTLNVGNTALTQKGVEEVLEHLLYNKVLEELDVSSNGISSTLKYLDSFLLRNKSLKVLNLSGNQLSPSIPALVAGLEFNRSLTALDISNGLIGVSRGALLCAVAKSCALLDFKIEGNGMESVTEKHILTAIDRNRANFRLPPLADTRSGQGRLWLGVDRGGDAGTNGPNGSGGASGPPPTQVTDNPSSGDSESNPNPSEAKDNVPPLDHHAKGRRATLVWEKSPLIPPLNKGEGPSDTTAVPISPNSAQSDGGSVKKTARSTSSDQSGETFESSFSHSERETTKEEKREREREKTITIPRVLLPIPRSQSPIEGIELPGADGTTLERFHSDSLSSADEDDTKDDEEEMTLEMSQGLNDTSLPTPMPEFIPNPNPNINNNNKSPRSSSIEARFLAMRTKHEDQPDPPFNAELAEQTLTLLFSNRWSSYQEMRLRQIKSALEDRILQQEFTSSRGRLHFDASILNTVLSIEKCLARLRS
jgi:hypothetical protein